MSGKMDAKDNLRTQWRGDRSHRRTLTGRFTERFVETRLPFCHHQRVHESAANSSVTDSIRNGSAYGQPVTNF
ncbi:hypothetical protein TNCV_683971 [Trichonephila clavipes]|nr:hypothetical protein TNCV_683971 [Trichonephila clavipes]